MIAHRTQGGEWRGDYLSLDCMLRAHHHTKGRSPSTNCRLACPAARPARKWARSCSRLPR
eukprot:7176248-Alexandrium_andersonii.AAC.1